jgi:hypothetical protein
MKIWPQWDKNFIIVCNMKMHLFHFIAFLIVLASMQVFDQRSLGFSESNEIKSIVSSSGWDLGPLREVDSKTVTKKNYIPQSFLPIFSIADTYIHTENFLYYLSVYNLVREKNYFLLI